MKGNRKIVFFVPNFTSGGAEKVMILLAEELSKDREIIFLVMNKNGDHRPKFNESNVELVSLDTGRMLQAIPKIIQFLVKYKPRVVLSTLVQANAAMLISNMLLFNITKVVVRLDMNYSEFKNKSSFSGIMNLIVNNAPTLYKYLAYKVIGVCMDVTNDIINNLGVPKQKCVTIYNPILAEDFETKTSQFTDCDWLEEKEKTPVVISVGRLSPQKNYIHLLESFILLRKKMEVKLIILGEGQDREKLENILEKNTKYSNDIILPGYKSNPLSWIKKSDLFVSTSIFEGASNALVEALATGVPIVATDCPGGSAEILKGGELGKLIEIDDVSGLTDAMFNSLNDSTTNVRVAEDWLAQFKIGHSSRSYIKTLLS